MTDDEFNKAWDSVADVGVQGPTVTEFLDHLNRFKQMNDTQELIQTIRKQVTKAIEEEITVNLPTCAIEDIEEVLKVMGFDIDDTEINTNEGQLDFWIKYPYLEDPTVSYTLSGSLWCGNFIFCKIEDEEQTMEIQELGLKYVRENVGPGNAIVFKDRWFDFYIDNCGQRGHYILPYVSYGKKVIKDNYIVRRILSFDNLVDKGKNHAVLGVVNLKECKVVSITSNYVQFEMLKFYFDDNSNKDKIKRLVDYNDYLNQWEDGFFKD